MDRLDAAHALLGVSPSSTTEKVRNPALLTPLTNQDLARVSPDHSSNRVESWDASLNRINSDKSRDSAEALSALAALASSAATLEPSSTPFHASYPVCSSDDDSEAMPPPPPRRGRMRSASNPEGMEKWDSLNRMRLCDRKHFVLPSSILEEELASANAAISFNAKAAAAGGLPFKKRVTMADQQMGIFSPDSLGTSPDSVISPVGLDSDDQESEDKSQEVFSDDNASPRDEADIEPEELLKRARARLLEDLSEGNINGEKGVLPLPHSLSKYKEIYNKNGRIGVYTPAERAAIIAKFNGKRSRRVWNKKIRYNCRKNLADRRMRVKGRFVKRSTEQAAALAAQQKDEPVTAIIAKSGSNTRSALAESLNSGSITPLSGPLSPVMEVGDDSENADENMPDVTDAEAGFDPTPDQPYRRTRRHTIT